MSRLDYESSLQCLATAEEIAASNALDSVLEVIGLWQAAVLWRAGSCAAAGRKLRRVRASTQRPTPMCEAMVCLFLAREAACSGRIQEATDLALGSDRAVMSMGSRLEEMLFGISIADVLLDVSRTEDARPLLSRSAALLEQAPTYHCWRASLLGIQARLALADGDNDGALDYLRQCLAIARQGTQRYYLRFLDLSLTPLVSTGAQARYGA